MAIKTSELIRDKRILNVRATEHCVSVQTGVMTKGLSDGRGQFALVKQDEDGVWTVVETVDWPVRHKS